MLIKYNNTEDEYEKNMIRRALSCSANETILEYYFNQSLKPGAIVNDTYRIMLDIHDNSIIGVNVTLNFAKTRARDVLLNFIKGLVTIIFWLNFLNHIIQVFN